MKSTKRPAAKPGPDAPRKGPRVYAIAGEKGGVGKSTCATAIAVEWHRRGRRVLLVDADTQGTVRRWAATASERGIDGPTVVSMGVGLHRPDQLPRLAASYDVVILDCPGRVDEVQRAALLVADVAVFPCGPGGFDAWAFASALRLVGEVRPFNPRLAGVALITRKQPGTVLGRGVRGTLSTEALPILDTELTYLVAYSEAGSAGMGPTTYDPKSVAAREVTRLVTELEALPGTGV